MGLYENIKSAAEEKGYSINRLEQEMKLPRSSIGKYNKNSPSVERISQISEFLEVPLSRLVLGNYEENNITNIFAIKLKPFPLLGEIACGKPKYTNEDRESYVMAGTDIKADFCLKARGDSMINARIHDGDIVFIRQQDEVENGEIAAVVINSSSEATLKRIFYYKEKSLLILKPENPTYEDIILTGEEINDVHILGKAIAFQSDVR